MSHSSFIPLCITHIIHSLQCYFDSTVSSGGQGWHCEAVGHDICSRESEDQPTHPNGEVVNLCQHRCGHPRHFVLQQHQSHLGLQSGDRCTSGLDGLVLRVHCWALPSLPLWKVKDGPSDPSDRTTDLHADNVCRVRC